MDVPLERLKRLVAYSHNGRKVYMVATSVGEVFVEKPNVLVTGDGFTDVASAKRALLLAADTLCVFNPFTNEAVTLRDRVLHKSPDEMIGVEYLIPGTGRAALRRMQSMKAATDQSGEIVVEGMLDGERVWVSSRGVHVSRTGQHDPTRIAKMLDSKLGVHLRYGTRPPGPPLSRQQCTRQAPSFSPLSAHPTRRFGARRSRATSPSPVSARSL